MQLGIPTHTHTLAHLPTERTHHFKKSMPTLQSTESDKKCQRRANKRWKEVGWIVWGKHCSKARFVFFLSVLCLLKRWKTVFPMINLFMSTNEGKSENMKVFVWVCAFVYPNKTITSAIMRERCQDSAHAKVHWMGSSSSCWTTRKNKHFEWKTKLC